MPPDPRVSLGQLIDLMLSWVASDDEGGNDSAPSEGLMQEITGIDRISLRALKLAAFRQAGLIIAADEPRRQANTAAYVARTMASQGKTEAEIAAWLAEHGLPHGSASTTDRPSSSPSGGNAGPMESTSPTGSGCRTGGVLPAPEMRLKWSSEKPMVEGCYWSRGDYWGDDGAHMVLIRKMGSRFLVHFNTDVPDGCQWAGPIPEPTD